MLLRNKKKPKCTYFCIFVCLSYHSIKELTGHKASKSTGCIKSKERSLIKLKKKNYSKEEGVIMPEMRKKKKQNIQRLWKGQKY